MTRLRDILLGSLLALALFAPGLAKADPMIVERPHFSDEIVGSGPDLVFIPGLASSRTRWPTTCSSTCGRTSRRSRCR